MVSFLIAFASWSGNTEEVSQLIQDTIVERGHEVQMYRIGVGPIPDPHQFDAMIIGSFTIDQGQTPEEVKDFVYDVGYKPDNVYVFGTGDTQFGGDSMFCLAAEKLGKFYQTRHSVLKIEQSPRGSQEQKVKEWAEGVIEIEEANEGKRTEPSKP